MSGVSFLVYSSGGELVHSSSAIPVSQHSSTRFPSDFERRSLYFLVSNDVCHILLSLLCATNMPDILHLSSGFILSFELKSRNANHSETLTRVISSFSAYLYNFEARTLARTQILDTKSISRAFRNRREYLGMQSSTLTILITY